MILERLELTDILTEELEIIDNKLKDVYKTMEITHLNEDIQILDTQKPRERKEIPRKNQNQNVNQTLSLANKRKFLEDELLITSDNASKKTKTTLTELTNSQAPVLNNNTQLVSSTQKNTQTQSKKQSTTIINLDDLDENDLDISL